MATTKAGRVGRVRQRLAALLNEALPDLSFAPEDLNSNYAIYATPHYDCASWSGFGRLRLLPGVTVSVTSWDTMRECVRGGIAVSNWCSNTYEIHAKQASNAHA